MSSHARHDAQAAAVVWPWSMARPGMACCIQSESWELTARWAGVLGATERWNHRGYLPTCLGGLANVECPTPCILLQLSPTKRRPGIGRHVTATPSRAIQGGESSCIRLQASPPDPTNIRDALLDFFACSTHISNSGRLQPTAADCVRRRTGCLGRIAGRDRTRVGTTSSTN